MKKPLTLPDDAPRKIQRADVPPAAELLTKYRMLQIEIYDAAKREQTKFS